ncbi:MAG: c-type cytochrome [Myxococcales bacterium]|nr:c-type cytochrome [Myxococcales bacterium]
MSRDSDHSVPGGVTDELLDHEYDGIREYDNPLPKWWVWIFWGSFWFALFYFFHYHIGAKGTSVAQAYVEELKEAREAEAKLAMGDAVSEEGLAKLMNNQAMMNDTKAIFKARCEQCHADKGQGLIGPNLTDDHWIHGKGTLMDIYKTVDEGVQAKGMPAWGRQLTPIELRKVVAYVGSIRGTNVAGKAPEGEKVDMAAVLKGDSAGAGAPSAGAAAPTDAPSAAPSGDAPAPSAEPAAAPSAQ